MSATNNGGPAFPTDSDRASRGVEHGMSMRDYFAAKAMGAFIQATADHNVVSPDVAMAAVSNMAFMMADAMLAEREKGGAA